MNIPMAAYPLTVTVRDASGNPAPNVAVSTDAPTNFDLSIGTMRAYGASSYSQYSTPPVTDANGVVTLWLFAGTYLLTAAPPFGSGYAVTNFPGIVVAGATTTELTLSTAVVLSGRVLDAEGNGLPSQRVLVKAAGAPTWAMDVTTDATGGYAFSLARGDYDLYVDGQNYNPLMAAPRSHYRYSYADSPLSVTGSLVMDIPMTAHKVDVLVQDPGGNPVSDVAISTDAPTNFDLTLGSMRAYGSSSYSAYSTPPKTDASGRATLWLFAATYLVTATPPGSLPFASITIHDVGVSGPKSLVIVLQFTHDTPVTTATLAPAPDASGRYSNPVTVTLAAVAAAGYSVAATYYRVDGGPTLTYSAPFTVAGGGDHVITYWSVDNTGVTELAQSLPFTIQAATIQTLAERTKAFCGSGISPQGICNSLLAKLDAAANAVRRGQPAVARMNVEAYMSELRAQRGKGVSQAAYDELSALAAIVLSRL
jgi:hypothetical protein